MAKVTKDFLSYLRAVFIESGRWVLAIFDIVGVVLFFLPHWAESFFQNVQTVRIVGGSAFLVSFLIANFTLYRKNMPHVVNDQSLLLYTHGTRSSNAVMMRYVGFERAVKLDVTLSYKDKSGQMKNKKVTQFFPSSDSQMLYHAAPLESLEAGEEAYFYLLSEENNSEGTVKVIASFTGAKSGKSVKVERVFPINIRNWNIT